MSSSSSSRSSPQPTKIRGRPPKPVVFELDEDDYKNLTKDDWKYIEKRSKNNAASRRSRLRRKSKETQLDRTVRLLEVRYWELKERDIRLQYEIQCWRKAIHKLALM